MECIGQFPPPPQSKYIGHWSPFLIYLLIFLVSGTPYLCPQPNENTLISVLLSLQCTGHWYPHENTLCNVFFFYPDVNTLAIGSLPRKIHWTFYFPWKCLGHSFFTSIKMFWPWKCIGQWFLLKKCFVNLFLKKIQILAVSIFRMTLVKKTKIPLTAIAYTLRKKSEFLVALADYSLRCYDTGKWKKNYIQCLQMLFPLKVFASLEFVFLIFGIYVVNPTSDEFFFFGWWNKWMRKHSESVYNCQHIH